jgi:protein TonB
MTESVTDIIVSRARRPEQLRLTVVGSCLAHAAVLGALLLVPHGSPPPPREVMKISLGGVPGPQTGGLTQLGGRAIQKVAPPEPPKPVETRAAPERPKMTLPEPKPAPQPPVKQAPAQAAAATPSSGEQVAPGSTPVDTGVRGTGFGLSSAGGAGGELQLDVSDFCCPEYLDLMIIAIRQNWRQDQGRPGTSVVRFTIRRDGTIDNVSIDRTSGSYPLDLAAQRAVQLTRLQPLPGAFPNSTLTVRMTFKY